jgi:hypothetical protein
MKKFKPTALQDQRNKEIETKELADPVGTACGPPVEKQWSVSPLFEELATMEFGTQRSGLSRTDMLTLFLVGMGFSVGLCVILMPFCPYIEKP